MANETLKTPEQYGKMFGKSKQRVYQIIQANNSKAVWIGGTKAEGGTPFVDIAKFPTWEGFSN